MNEKQPPTSFRLKPDIRLWLSEKARAGDRSLNSEVNRLLRKVKESEERKSESSGK